MNQNSDLNFRKLQENNLTSKANENVDIDDGIKNYPTHGNIRNLTLILVDGRKQFLNYSYLVTCEHLPDEMLIKLSFTSHTVTLKGINLSKLFEDLSVHLPEKIVCTEKRYNCIREKEECLINEIVITVNN